MTFPSANTPDVEETVQRLKELSNQAIEAGKQNGQNWLDAYEQLLNSYLKLQKQAAESTKLEWVNTLANTNADFVREMSQVYLTTVREQLK
jgi:signal-transduction protein with cAMP-binding, CBS, and nucleotidyltransferase domain